MMKITKAHIVSAVDQLSADATTRDALDALMVLWKVDNSLKQNKKVSQQEVEQHFLSRRKKRE
ncbi:hypothetical protein CK503_03115 [Aliifodinibius salipaludis]|uniref:Uncharacterized protein n=1 Tax=Fodinibius salipaludis TaxID=2032627 RepID=A0A2A2GDY2_9BACT|nr:hypothetical protein [Aliifodinibius salipaludis]PAU95204.1 hypothetical protein CK503_03115 [Aliifodinibius salipaludis]